MGILQIITGEVIPKPKGDIQEKTEDPGVDTASGDYEEIVSRIIPDGKTFHLAKIKVPCKNSHWVKVTLGDPGAPGDPGYPLNTYPADIVPDDTTFIDWFPWDSGVVGDGSTKNVIIWAKKVTTGENLYGTIWGQE